MIYHIISHRLRFISLVFVISMLSIQCECGLGKKSSRTTPKASEIDHQELGRLIKLVRDKTVQDPKLYSLLAVLEKIKKGENLRTTIQNCAGHETPLYDAVTFFDEPSLIEQLTKHGFNINIEQAIAISNNRPTLLHRAIEVEHIQVANFLIRHGSNINEQDQKKHTPLHTAIVNRRTKALKWLIEQGAELHSPSKNPYLIFATENNYLEG
jgi:ankyrin repeat protein